MNRILEVTDEDETLALEFLELDAPQERKDITGETSGNVPDQ